jgi:hypothetical protein
MKFAPLVAVVFVLIGMIPFQTGVNAGPAFDPASMAFSAPHSAGSVVELDSNFTFDTGIVSARIVQNGVERTSTFNMDGQHIGETMEVSGKGGGDAGSDRVLVTYRDSDGFAQLEMSVIKDKANTMSLPEGIKLSILISEVNATNVSVTMSGKQNSTEISFNCTFPVSRLAGAVVGMGNMMTGRVTYSRGENVSVYGFGFSTEVRLTVTDGLGGIVAQETLMPQNHLIRYTWNIDADAKYGNYSIVVTPTNASTNEVSANSEYRFGVTVQNPKEHLHSPSGAQAVISLGPVPLWAAGVGAVLVVGVPIGVLLIKKKKD